MAEKSPCLDFSAARTSEEICAIARNALAALKRRQRQQLRDDFAVAAPIARYTGEIDRILIALYRHFLAGTRTALVAIGGYGRAELFPRSDIDILLLKKDDDPRTAQALEHYIRSLWCLGLDIAQSVRTPKESRDDAKKDSDMLTSLIEARLLTGDAALFRAIDVIDPPLIPRRRFFAQKLEEQRLRDRRQAQSGRLEPNVKTDTGGLRDVHMIGWLNRYCRGGKNPFDLQTLLKDDEYRELVRSCHTLWKIRFALHLNGKTRKDCLSFEQQKRLATAFGYANAANNAGIEQFMRTYYRASLSIRCLNRLAVKLIDAELRGASPVVVALDENFLLIDDHLALRDHNALPARPALLWQIFLHLLDNARIDSISPPLARQLRKQCRELLDEKFLRDRQMNEGFLSILNHRGDVYRQLRRMHRYGILSHYLPGFAHATGLMQFDLFHEYTVDQHTLRLIDFLDRFKRFQPDYPLAQELMRNLRHPAILYLAALFHDLGKGREGDHSEIGASIVETFLARNPAITADDGKLLVFLVRHHLTLSTTAQKKDLSDPAVIAAFARLFPDSEHLDYLYLLTLADISATNGNLWNSWRANLLYTLYRLTLNTLNAVTPSLAQQLKALERRALEMLEEDPVTIEQIWRHLPSAFFLNEPPLLIARKTRALLENPDRDFALYLRNHPPRIFIAAGISPDILFARVTHFMEKNNLNIVEARLYSDKKHKRALQQYTLSDAGEFDETLRKRLNQTISGNLPPQPLGARFVPRPLQYFDADTQITYHQEPQHRRTVLELVCKDRHGLLSIVSRVFLEHRLHLVHAKIATFGERAEDTFYLTDHGGHPIEDPCVLDALAATLENVLQ